jgi:Leucine-rich repeat (LRR) protein
MNTCVWPLFLKTVFAAMLAISARGVVYAQELKTELVRPTPEVIAAWEHAGARFGWMSVSRSPQQTNTDWDQAGAECVPAFGFNRFPTGGLRSLPPPDVPFGLSVYSWTDEGMQELRDLTQLRSLFFNGDGITDAGLKELAGLEKLQALRIEACWQATEGGWRGLAGLKQLKALNLSRNSIDDAALKHIAGLTQLNELVLQGSAVTDVGLQELVGLTQLKRLHLWDTGVTDDGLKKLAGFKQLEKLSLAGSRVTGSGLKHLEALPKLKSLGLYGSHGDFHSTRED